MDCGRQWPGYGKQHSEVTRPALPLELQSGLSSPQNNLSLWETFFWDK